MQTSHALTEKHYDEFRAKSLEMAQKVISPSYGDRVSLRQIDSLSLAHAERWEASLDRSDDAAWNWTGDKGFRKYAYRHPKRFDLAIWYANTQLCGLSIGKPTYNSSKMRLDVLEGAPENHPLKRKVVEITVLACEAYASLIGAEQIRIMKPVNANVIKYYESFGFTLRQGKASNVPTYLWRNL